MNTHAPVQGKPLLDADGLGRTLSRIAHEIIEGNPELDLAGSAAGEAVGARRVDRAASGGSPVALVGIQTRGVPLARRLARLIEERAGVEPALGTAKTAVAYPGPPPPCPTTVPSGLPGSAITPRP